MMRIVVCVKEVPDTTDVKMDPEHGTLIRDGVPSIINPFDAFALELGLQLKDKDPSIEVVTICMGPPHSEKSLRETVAMGSDSAILVTDRAFAGSDTWATSYTLASAIKAIGGADLILAGQQAIDGDTAQVGPGIAEFLEIPQAIFVGSIEIQTEKEIVAERLTETGRERVKLGLPALVSVIKLTKDPRLPSLRGMMKAKKAEIRHISANELDVEERNIGLSGSPTRVMKIFTPPKRTSGEIWEGDPLENGKRLAETLCQHSIM
jgi:electron transfer flavoprotein beta subunit